MTLPYELGTPASFDYTGMNGRGLMDNVLDNVLSVSTDSRWAPVFATSADPAEFPVLQLSVTPLSCSQGPHQEGLQHLEGHAVNQQVADRQLHRDVARAISATGPSIR